MTVITETTAADHLRATFAGAVVAPGDDAWDASRQAFNLTVDQRPTLVAIPADRDDVVTAVRFAADHDLQVAAQRTGHNAAPLGPLNDTLLLKTDALQGVQIDVARRRARVRAGAKWANVVPQASELGLAALHGSTPDVSIVGYSLGGGLGWYGRKWGLASNSVTAIELVTADGELRRVDHDHEPGLFWALRGGGGNFGVVTAMEFGLHPVKELYAGILFFPWERSAEVLHAWREWVETVPDEVTSVGRIMQFPPLPDVPEPMRGKSFVLVEAFSLGTEAEGIERIAPLRKLAPVLDTFAMVPPVGLSEIHMDPPTPMPFVSDHSILGDLPAKAIDDLVAVAGPGSGSPLVTLEVRHTGGALGRAKPHHGALASLPGEFVMFGGGMAIDPATTAANVAQLDLVAEALRPYDAGRYLNFTESRTDSRRFFSAETYARLRAVKADSDPENLFRANHPIPAAA